MRSVPESAAAVGDGQHKLSGQVSAGTLASRFAWLPPAVLAILTVVSLWLQPPGVFDPPWLLLTLNTLFLTVLPLGVAALAAVAYRSSGLVSVLAIGAGMLALAGGGTLPAVLQGTYATNAVVAMHNSAFLLSAGGLFVASLTAVGVVPLQLPGSRVAHVAAAYTVVVVCVGAVLALVVTGRMPTFFVQGQGPTELRQVVLVVALCLFGLAAVFWWQAYVRARLPFLRWYYLAMALFCLAPVALLLQTSVGSAIGWIGRCAQYIAVPYVLIAVLSVRAAAGAGGIENRFAAALLQATLPYRPLLDSVTEAIVVLDDRGAVLYWNDAATRMFGVDAAESFGADFAGLIAQEPRQQELRAALAAHATSPETPADRLTTTAVDSSGRQFPVEAAFYGNRLGGRELAICVVRDITDRRKAEEQLRQAEWRNQMLAENENLARELTATVDELTASRAEFQRTAQLAAVGRVAGAVSHEINNPVMGVLGYLAFIRKRSTDEEVIKYADKAYREVERIGRISRSLLALGLSPPDPSGQPPAPFDVAAAAANVVELVASQMLEAQVEVDLQPAPGDLPLAAGLASDFQQALLNLLLNARDAVRPGTDRLIEVSIRHDDRWITLTVADTGPGVPPDLRSRIFEPFFTTKGAGEGAGLGLSAATELMERMGGSVGLAPGSRPGASFVLRLGVGEDSYSR